MASKWQNGKFVNVLPPVARVDNASYTTTEIDTKGYDAATIIVNLGATDIAMTALKVQESDTSGSGFADISGASFDGGNATDNGTLTLPDTTDDAVYVFQIGLDGRKRYLDLVATAGDGTLGTFASAVCILHNADVHPSVTTDRASGGVCRV